MKTVEIYKLIRQLINHEYIIESISVSKETIEIKVHFYSIPSSFLDILIKQQIEFSLIPFNDSTLIEISL